MKSSLQKSMQSSNGFTLIEVLVAMVIASISVVGLLSVMDSIRAQMIRQQTKWSAERISRTLIDLASLPATIRATSVQTDNPEGEDFFRQIAGWKSAHHLEDFKPIRLNLPFLEKVGGTYMIGGQFTGTQSSPMRYNRLGEICDTHESICPADAWPIEVYSDYNFSCPPLYYKGYDNIKRGGEPYYGPIDDPAAMTIPTKCISKSQINIRLTIRESIDATHPTRDTFSDIVEVIKLSITPIKDRY